MNRPLLITALWLTGCLPALEIPNLPSDPEQDFDGDGLTEAQGDCNDQDSTVLDIVWYADGDGDAFGQGQGIADCFAPAAEGWASVDGDCKDDASDVHPGAQESCDGVDNDCTGDEIGAVDATTFYYDGDNDKHGDALVLLESCSQPGGYSALADDCDDARSDVYPGADESCDVDYDQNCDGSFGSADNDGDLTLACDDCDDGDKDVHPGAAEVCNGGIDDDCNRFADDGDVLTTGKGSWYTDTDEDGFGLGLPTVACEAPAGKVGEAGDCDDAAPDVNPASTVDECDGVDHDCSGGGPYEDDGDGDGAVTCDDCDDLDPDVSPDAAEVCNDLDDDCDGAVDDADVDVVGAPDWFPDGDGDGFGVGVAVFACEAPTNTAGLDTDCDDSDAGISPGDVEICGDGIDQDCSGKADNGCLGPIVNHAGPITADQVWAAGNTHVLTASVEVKNGALLTIEDGATVLGAPGVVLSVSGGGGIDASGTVNGIVFDEATPGAGWGGLKVTLGTDTDITVFDGISVFNAGVGQAASVVVDRNLAVISNCEIADGAADGVNVTGSSSDLGRLRMHDCWVHDNVGDGVEIAAWGQIDRGGLTERTFLANDLEQNGAYPLRAYLDDLGELGIDGHYDAAVTRFDTVYVPGGTVTVDAEWVGIDAPYTLDKDVDVRADLRLGAGADLRFKSGGSMIVGGGGAGSLAVDAITNPAVLQGTTAGAGTWKGLSFGGNSDDTATHLNGVVVRGAGGSGSSAAISINGAVVPASHLTVEDSATDGWFTDWYAVSPISDSTFRNNAGVGIRLDHYGELGAAGAFARNTITGSGLSPLIILHSNLGSIASDNVLTGNGTDFVEVKPGSGPFNVPLRIEDPGIPYLMHADLLGRAGAKITIGAGVEMRFDPTFSISVRDSGASLTTEAGVVLTRSGSTGYWGGVSLAWSAGPNVFTDLTLEYGGGGASTSCLYVHADVELNNSVIRNCEGSGIEQYGGVLRMDGVTVSGATGDGYYDLANSTGTIGQVVNTTVTGNGGYPVSIPVTKAQLMSGAGNSFTGNVQDKFNLSGWDNWLAGGVFPDPGVPYRIGSRVVVGAATSFTPGTVFQFYGAGYMDFPAAGSWGGTPTKPVVFTSAQATPAPGDWRGLHTYPGGHREFHDVIVDYAGGGTSDPAAISCAWDTVAVRDAVVRYSASYGLGSYFYCGGVTATNVTFLGNVAGDRNF